MLVLEFPWQRWQFLLEKEWWAVVSIAIEYAIQYATVNAIEYTIQYIIEYAIEHTIKNTFEYTITYEVEYARGRWHLVLAGERRVCKHPVGGAALPSI